MKRFKKVLVSFVLAISLLFAGAAVASAHSKSGGPGNYPQSTAPPQTAPFSFSQVCSLTGLKSALTQINDAALARLLINEYLQCSTLSGGCACDSSSLIIPYEQTGCYGNYGGWSGYGNSAYGGWSGNGYGNWQHWRMLIRRYHQHQQQQFFPTSPASPACTTNSFNGLGRGFGSGTGICTTP